MRAGLKELVKIVREEPLGRAAAVGFAMTAAAWAWLVLTLPGG